MLVVNRLTAAELAAVKAVGYPRCGRPGHHGSPGAAMR